MLGMDVTVEDLEGDGAGSSGMMSAQARRGPRKASAGGGGASSDGLTLALKFLITHAQAGSLIGRGGSSIKDIQSITGAGVFVSAEPYPGALERTVYVVGDVDSLGQVAALVVELFAEHTQNAGPGSDWTWDPKASLANLGRNDHVRVPSFKFTVPCSSAGLLLGRGGDNFKQMAKESGVTSITMNNKEEESVGITQERVIEISGTVTSCVSCIYLVLAKLSEDIEAAQVR